MASFCPSRRRRGEYANALFLTLKTPRKLRKGIIPAAGMGTRVQSLTKDEPKEMLPIAGKPIISYVVQEAALSGLENLYIVINARKDSLRRYLESKDMMRDIREGHGQNIPAPRLTFVDQPVPAGSGDAIYQTRELIGDEPFALMMPDFIFFGDTLLALQQLIPLYEQCESDIVGLLALQGEEGEGFGNVGIAHGEEREPGIVVIRTLSSKIADPLILEKDEQILKAVPRWILGQDFFSYLERTKGEGEWDDTPALQMLCVERKVVGKVLQGRGFDVGNPIGYQAAGTFTEQLDANGKRW
jgi:UTP--glucose-1-phosphate uridylyltransferase